MSPASRRALVAASLLAATLALALPLLISDGLPAGSDVVFAYHSAYGFRAALGEGVLYPRWVDNSNHGFGGATFIYYAPLPYYAVSLAGLALDDLGDAFKLVLILAALLSGWALYLCARPVAGRTGAALGAAVYILAPYHALDLYDRFAFAEYCAFLWFPLIALALRRILAEGRVRAWLGLSAALTGLLLTHLVTAYMGALVLGPYALYLSIRAGRWRRWLPVAAAGALALAAAAAFWLPMIMQRPAVHMEWVVEAPYGDWRRNFVYRDEVAFGYGPAPIKPWVNGVATTQALAGLVGIVTLILGRRRAASAGEAAPLLTSDRVTLWEGEAQAVLVAWTFFLQIPLSSPLWRLVPELGTVQFPWRFGLFQALSVAMLTAVSCGVLIRSSGSGRSRMPGRLVLAGLVLALLPGMVLTARLLRNPARPLNFDHKLASRPFYLQRVMTEYLPQGMVGWQEFADQPYRTSPAAVFDGPGRVEVLTWQTHFRRLAIEADGPGLVRLRTFQHPGWRALLDGEPVPTTADNPMRLLTVAVPTGRHELVVRFGSTPDRRAGAALSLAGLATMLALTVGRLARLRRESRSETA